MNINKSQRTMLSGMAAALVAVFCVLQAWIDQPGMRRQAAIEPPNMIKAGGPLGNTGAALPFEYTLGALTGFRQVIAGILWVRSDSFFHSGNYDAILPLIRLITWLDPNWLDPYATGAWHLMYNFTDTDQRSDRRYLPAGIALLKEGIANNPSTYDMYKEAGWNEFDKIKDYQRAADFYLDAEKNDPNYDVTQVGHQLAHCYERLGRVDDAIAEWEKCAAKHKQLEDDPKSTPDVKSRNQQGYRNAQSNLNILRERKKFRVNDTAQPVDAKFAVKVIRVKPKVIEVSGEWNLIGAKNFSDETGLLVAGPVDGARVTVRLQDTGYKFSEPKEFSFEVNDKLTIMQDALSVRGGITVKPGEVYLTTKVNGGSVQKNAEQVAVYPVGPADNPASIGLPLDKALAGGTPLTEWGKLQAVSLAYPLRYGSKQKQYTPAEVGPLFAKLKTDTAKIAALTKQGYGIALKGLEKPGTYKREIDMSKDPKMYSFSADTFDLIVSVDPRQTPDFVKDRIGWTGQALTDKNYLDDKTIPGTHLLVKKITLTRDDLLGQGRKVLSER